MFFKQTLRRLTLGLVFVFCAAPFCEARSSKQASVILSPNACAPVPTQTPASRGRTFVPLHFSLIDQAGMKQLNFWALCPFTIRRPTTRWLLTGSNIATARDADGAEDAAPPESRNDRTDKKDI